MTPSLTSAHVSWGRGAVRYVPFVLAAISDHLIVTAMLIVVGWRLAGLTMSHREARLFSTLASVASLLFVYLENSAIALA